MVIPVDGFLQNNCKLGQLNTVTVAHECIYKMDDSVTGLKVAWGRRAGPHSIELPRKRG